MNRFTLIFAVIGFGPLVLLAFRNVRAVPVGLFGVAAMFAGTYGLFMIAGSEGGTRAFYVGLTVILAILLVLSFQFSADTLGQRVKWLLLSYAAWAIAFTFGWRTLENLRLDMGAEKRKAERAVAAADSARKHEALERAPADRGDVLRRQLRLVVAKQHPFIGEPRYLIFGDPATNPEAVTVWAVLDLDKDQRFDLFALDLRNVYSTLTRALGKEGYTWPVAVGAADQRDVTALGGDDAFFGKNGEYVIPQLAGGVDPDRVYDHEMRELEPPVLTPAGRRARVVTGPAPQVPGKPDLSELTVTLETSRGAAELIVVDPMGQRVKNQDSSTAKTITIRQPTPGYHTILVNGLRDGRYTLRVRLTTPRGEVRLGDANNDELYQGGLYRYGLRYDARTGPITIKRE
jgi:hypothetical protein